jgi:uncharacterized membrane protein YfcA
MLPQGALLWWRFGWQLWDSLVLGAAGVFQVLIGTAIGLRLGSDLPKARLRRLTYLLLVLLAASAIVWPG